MMEFHATLAASFSGKYFHLPGDRAMEESLWWSFVLLLPRPFPVSISSCVAELRVTLPPILDVIYRTKTISELLYSTRLRHKLKF